MDIFNNISLYAYIYSSSHLCPFQSSSLPVDLPLPLPLLRHHPIWGSHRNNIYIYNGKRQQPMAINYPLLCKLHCVIVAGPLHCITPAKLVNRALPMPPPTPPPTPPPGDVMLWRALFVSSSVIFCSIRNWASVRLFGCPDILTMRFLVPGAKIPLLEICMFAPDRC